MNLRVKLISYPMAFIVIVLMSVIPTSATIAETKDIKIPKQILISAINAYAKGFEVQLDNWGGFRSSGGGTWHTENSYVRFPSGRKEILDIPRSPKFQTAFKRYNAYVDNFSTRSVDVQPDNKKLKLRVFFESAGNEIRVGCINRRKDKPCEAHLLKHKGDINNAQIFAWFEPQFSGSKIEINPSDLTLDFDLSLDSWILDNMRSVLEHFINVKGRVRSKVKSTFLDELSKPQVKKLLSKDVNAELFRLLSAALKNRLGSKTTGFISNKVRIKSIRDSGGNYIVTFQYPDIIASNSAKVLSFKPKSKSLTAGCPFNFGFDATIKTNTKMRGKVWLIGRNGDRLSPKNNWSVGKKGISNSTISTRINGEPEQKRSGAAQLVVQWGGTDGKRYLTKSQPVRYSATCSKSTGKLGFENKP